MDVRSQCEKRLRSALMLFDEAVSLGFPYPNAKDAVERLIDLLESRLDDIQRLNEDAAEDAKRMIYKRSLGTISFTLELLGFLIRSADVRNSFELYDPIADLVAKLFNVEEGEAKLVLSSEWDYSPFTYIHSAVPPMNQYVFIGLPASETRNALVTPLIAHEIGHHIWQRNKFKDKYNADLATKAIEVIKLEFSNEFGPDNLQPLSDLYDAGDIVAWSVGQMEELFCDFLGIRYFGASFLHAYAYLLMPSLPGGRSVEYPSASERANAHQKAAERFGVAIPDDYLSLFDDSENPADSELNLRVVGRVVEATLDDLIQLVDGIVGGSGLEGYDENKADGIFKRFALGVPVGEAEALVNIVNAGWKFYSDGFSQWRGRYQDVWEDAGRRERTLSDLMFKSMEISHLKEAC